MSNGEFVKLGFLWEDAPNQSDGILDCTLLPAVVRFTEEGSSTKDVVDVNVLDIFFAVVIGDCPSSPMRMMRESPVNGGGGCVRGAPDKFGYFS